jgi:hypothetical protein
MGMYPGGNNTCSYKLKTRKTEMETENNNLTENNVLHFFPVPGICLTTSTGVTDGERI